MNTNGWVVIAAASIMSLIAGAWYFDKLATKREVDRRVEEFNGELDSLAKKVSGGIFD